MATFRTLSAPNTLFWEITDKCNHNCIHCFNYWRSDVQRGASCAEFAEGQDWETLLEKIIACKPAKVILTGGEPLAVWSRTKEIIRRLYEAGIGVSMNTNAALVNEEMARALRDFRVPLFVSFPSADEKEFDEITDTPGAYGRVLAALDLLQENGAYFSVNMVVSQINLSSVFDTAKLMKARYGVNGFTATRVSEPVNAREKFSPYLLSRQGLEEYAAQCVRIKKELGMEVRAASPVTPCSLVDSEALALFGLQGGCEAGKTSCVVSASGAVRACARDFTEYGNLLDDDFPTIWARMQPWRDETMIPTECADCKHRPACRGGCRIDGLVRRERHDCLDLYSDTNNTHPEFVRESEPLPAWGLHQAFRPAKELSLLREPFGVRVSTRQSSYYCTEKLAEYLTKTERFTVGTFCRAFNVDVSRGVQVLFTLYKKRLISMEK